MGNNVIIMTAYFAELDQNNIVKRVIASETKEWCENTLGGTWVQTYYDTPGKNYAGVGHEYVSKDDNFKPNKPFNSWVFDDASYSWKSPKKPPVGVGLYEWDEASGDWVPNVASEQLNTIWQQSII